jgi:uncharacterized Zn-binding protein involved in type VI secretion
MPGKPAARLGDTAMDCADPVDTPTGTVVAAGTVFINKIPAAKKGDQIMGVDIHIIMIPSPGGPIPTPLPHPFAGIIDGELESTVKIMGMPAATVGSTASNKPPHIPQGGAFQKPPANKSKIIMGSPNVFIGSGSGGGSGGGNGSVSGGTSGIFQVEVESSGVSSESEESHFLDMAIKDADELYVIGPRYHLTGSDNKEDDSHLSGEIIRRRVPEGEGEAELRDIIKAYWSSQQELIPGKTVKLQIETVGMDDGTKVTFEIFERNPAKADKMIRRIDTAAISGDKAEAEWIYVIPDQPSGAPNADGFNKPDYYFIVESGDIRKRAPILDCTADLEMELKYDTEKGDPITDEPYQLHLSSGEIRKGKTDGSGWIREKRVPVKDALIEFTELDVIIEARLVLVRPEGGGEYTSDPRVDHLQWSTDAADSGQTVTMSADIWNIDNGTKVTFTVYEYQKDGKHKQTEVMEDTVQGDITEVSWVLPDNLADGATEKAPQFFFTVSAAGKVLGDKQESGFLLPRSDKAYVEVILDKNSANRTIELLGPETRTAKADKDGRAVFEKLIPGEYTVRTLSSK